MKVTSGIRPNPPAPAARGSTTWLWLAALCIAAACFWFADRVGFEGDGLAFMFGIDNLDQVGRDHVYRYYWQPLAYDLLSSIAQRFSSPLQLMPLSTGFAVLGIVGQLVLLRRLLQPAPFALGLGLIWVLAAPELLVTSLYFNTTALALPFFTGCLLALHAAGSADRPLPLAVIGGALMAVACLFRLDFLACVPFAIACLMRWGGARWPRLLWPAAAGGIAVALAFIALQPNFLSGAMSILGTFSDGEFPINMVGRFKVIVVTFGPALVIFPLSVLYLRALQRSAKPAMPRPFPRTIWLLLALLPTLAPLNNLYSGKYLVPFIACLLVLLADCTGRAYAQARQPEEPVRRARKLVRFSAALLLLSLAVGVPDFAALRAQPLLAFVTQPWRVGTHDGPRTAGAYLAYANWVRTFRQRQDNVVMYHGLAKVIDSCERNVTVAMSSLPKYGSNEWSWGFLPLYLEDRGWKLVHYEPARKAELVHAPSKRQVQILHHDLAATAAMAPDAFKLDFDKLLPLNGEDFWAKSRRWVEAMQRGGPCIAASPADR